MKIGYLLVAGMIASTMFSDSANCQSGALDQGVLGVLHSDGSFVPLLHRQQASRAITTSVTGTLQLNLTISIRTALIAGTAIYCGLTSTVAGAGPGGVIDSVKETAVAPAHISASGTVATCSVSIPYEWHLAALDGPATDVLSVSYSATATDSSEGGSGRTSSVSLTTTSVPRNGATTSFNESARL
jgi:hypothetical protein